MFGFVLSPWPRYYTYADLLLNIVGYVPLGFLVALTLRPQLSVRASAFAATAAGTLLSLALVFPLVRGGITLDNYENLRLVWPVTAAFFLVAALPTFLVLRERATRRREPFGYYLRNGFSRLGQTLHAARTFRELVRFLAVFFVFSIGLTAIIAFFGVYAVTTLHFTPVGFCGVCGGEPSAHTTKEILFFG